MSIKKERLGSKRCCMMVHGPSRWPEFFQCQRAGKVRVGGKLYCLQHSPAKVKERAAEREAKWAAKHRAADAIQVLQWSARDFLAALENIAGGGDAATLVRIAKQAIGRYKRQLR